MRARAQCHLLHDPAITDAGIHEASKGCQAQHLARNAASADMAGYFGCAALSSSHDSVLRTPLDSLKLLP